MNFLSTYIIDKKLKKRRKKFVKYSCKDKILTEFFKDEYAKNPCYPGGDPSFYWWDFIKLDIK